MFELTEEQQMIRDTVRRIADNEVARRAAEIDAKGEFPWDIKELFQEYGLFGIDIPEEYGGTGIDHLALCLAEEEIARQCTSSSLILQVQALAASVIVIGGGDEQKKQYLPPLASGEKLGAFCLTEPGAGSDASAMSTRARRVGDKYVLNGLKHFISNGGVADTYCVFAMTDPEKGVRGISAFVVEKTFPGFKVGKTEEKMGIRGSPTTEILFEDCEVPAENLLGNEGDGFRIAMKCLDKSRPVIAAQAVGIAQGALDYATKYAKERVQFGKPIAALQGIQFMLAEMTTLVEAARSLTYRAAALVDKGTAEVPLMSAACKLFASDVAMKVTVDAVQIAGGFGYTKDLPLERYMRDAKITQIYEGTNQIQKVVIARRMGLG